MSEVEFILVPVSIVLGLAFARLLEGLYIASESPARYWVHTLWLFNKLCQILIYFWGFRSNGVVGQLVRNMDFAGLLLTMSLPTIVFLQALALVGMEPDSKRDWEQQFYANRTRFFALNCLMIVTSALSVLRFGIPVPLGAFGFVLLLSVTAVLSSDRRLQAAVAIVALLTVALGMGWPIIEAS